MLDHTSLDDCDMEGLRSKGQPSGLANENKMALECFGHMLLTHGGTKQHHGALHPPVSNSASVCKGAMWIPRTTSLSLLRDVSLILELDLSRFASGVPISRLPFPGLAFQLAW